MKYRFKVPNLLRQTWISKKLRLANIAFSFLEHASFHFFPVALSPFFSHPLEFSVFIEHLFLFSKTKYKVLSLFYFQFLSFWRSSCLLTFNSIKCLCPSLTASLFLLSPFEQVANLCTRFHLANLIPYGKSLSTMNMSH